MRAGAGDKPARAIRVPAPGRTLLHDAVDHPRARDRAARLDQSHAVRLWKRAGGSPVFGPPCRRRLCVPAEGEDMRPAVADVQVIPPRSGASLRLAKGQVLTVIDPEGEQVSDLVAYNARDIEEYISSGRSIDYASRIFLTKGDVLYSNRSNPMLTIVRDDV